MTVRTIDELAVSTGVDVLAHLDRKLEIPLLSGLQFQGDVAIVPTGSRRATTPVPARGVAVVRGENGGNTHAIQADGRVSCDVREASATDLLLAVLTVESGEAVLCHPEHGFNRIGPGDYELRRQREQADELRLVAD